MPTTRLETAGHVESLLEGLKESSFCIVSKESLESILRDNVNLHTATHQLNERMVSAIEKLNSFQESNAVQETASKELLIERLDLLIEKISTKNTLSHPEDAMDIETELKKRKETVEKLTRNKEMSKYYEGLLAEPEPFVRREFRTRVNRTTTDRELVHRRQQAIERVRTEIKIMEERVLEYTEKKNSIEQGINEFLATNEERRTEIDQRMATQVRSVKDIFERNTMAKIKNTDDEEKMNTFEYLITVAENDSLNYRGQSSHTRRRGGRSRRARQPAY